MAANVLKHPARANVYMCAFETIRIENKSVLKCRIVCRIYSNVCDGKSGNIVGILLEADGSKHHHPHTEFQ